MFNIICFFRLRWNFIPCNTQNLRTPFHELFKKCIQKYTLVQPKPLSTCSAWLPGSSLMSLLSKFPPSPWEIFILIISHHRLAWHILELHINKSYCTYSFVKGFFLTTYVAICCCWVVFPCMNVSLLMHSPIDGQLGCFHFLAIQCIYFN